MVIAGGQFQRDYPKHQRAEDRLILHGGLSPSMLDWSPSRGSQRRR